MEPCKDLVKESAMLMALNIIGDGDVYKGWTMMMKIAGRVAYARDKHPVFANSLLLAKKVIVDEVYEFCEAVGNETEERQKDEALDVMATLVRFYLDEHKL